MSPSQTDSQDKFIRYICLRSSYYKSIFHRKNFIRTETLDILTALRVILYNILFIRHFVRPKNHVSVIYSKKEKLGYNVKLLEVSSLHMTIIRNVQQGVGLGVSSLFHNIFNLQKIIFSMPPRSYGSVSGEVSDVEAARVRDTEHKSSYQELQAKINFRWR